jgi:hypothetical protein
MPFTEGTKTCWDNTSADVKVTGLWKILKQAPLRPETQTDRTLKVHVCCNQHGKRHWRNYRNVANQADRQAPCQCWHVSCLSVNYSVIFITINSRPPATELPRICGLFSIALTIRTWHNASEIGAVSVLSWKVEDPPAQMSQIEVANNYYYSPFHLRIEADSLSETQ